MRLFVCTNHTTFWPVGGASVVVAADLAQAHELLCAELKDKGLRPNDFTLEEVDLSTAKALVLCTGEY